jgi:hypothetical protein
MEDVLDVYQRPYDQQRPVVCMDEVPRQLLDEGREPLPLQPGSPLRYDYHYKRRGVVNLFMFFEPLARWRAVMVRAQRTKSDWAQCLKKLLTTRYSEVEKVILVMDNLNTHDPSSFYEAFNPSLARKLTSRLEIHYTPEHGSWLNMAEIENSAMAKQCLARRIPTKQDMSKQTNAWADQRNETKASIDWQFQTKDARIKLKQLYPIIDD